MLVTLNEVFESNKGHATGAFNVTSLETLQAILQGATAENKAVILSYANVHTPYISLDVMGPIMVDMAKKASIPVCVHLDHADTREICMQAMRLGFTSLMYDASHKDFDVNVAETADVVALAHSVGVTVEAELGNILVHDEETLEHGVSGDQDLDKIYTDPDKAVAFVEATGVDALAIAFGTVHGIYRVKPVLDLDRITKIKEKVQVPLVMHGGSGLGKEEFQTAIRNGIRKINFYTYLSLCGGSAVADYCSRTPKEEVLFHDVATVAREAMTEDVRNTIRVFSLQD